MKVAIEKGIKALAERITSDVKSEDALRLTQAALNLAHVLSVQANTATVEKVSST